MSKSKVKLSDVLGRLVRRGEKAHVELARGLQVAYTPAEGEEGVQRLCLSRKGVRVPSDFEGQTVWSQLVKAGVLQKPYRREVFGHDDRGCFVIEWQENVQRELF